MTEHEQTIRDCCQRRNIRIDHLPSGALRLTGSGVSLVVANIESIQIGNLEPYEPRKVHAQARHCPVLEYK